MEHLVKVQQTFPRLGLQQAIVYIPFLQLWSVFLSSVAADSQQQHGTPQGEQLN